MRLPHVATTDDKGMSQRPFSKNKQAVELGTTCFAPPAKFCWHTPESMKERMRREYEVIHWFELECRKAGGAQLMQQAHTPA